MRSKSINTVIVFLISLLFIYTAVGKLAGFRIFYLQLSQSPFVYPYAVWLRFLVPACEILVVVLLAFEPTRLAGFYGAVFLMTLFTAYVSAMLQFSDYLPCSCGGVIESLSWKQHLVFNCFFLLAALYGVYMTSHQASEKHIVKREA